MTVVNVSTRRQNGIESLDDFFFVSREYVLSCYDLSEIIFPMTGVKQS